MKSQLARYKKLIRQIQKLGVIFPGTLRTIYQRCGKPTCACASGKAEHAHGPYLYWDRKLNDKLASVSVKVKHKRFFKDGIANRKEFDRIKKQLLILGDNIAKYVNSQ